MIVFITNQSILGKFRQNKKQNLGKKVSKTSNNFSTFFLWAKKTAGLASSYWEFIKCINKVSPNQDYSYAVLLSLGLSRSSCSRQRSLFFLSGTLPQENTHLWGSTVQGTCKWKGCPVCPLTIHPP